MHESTQSAGIPMQEHRENLLGDAPQTHRPLLLDYAASDFPRLMRAISSDDDFLNHYLSSRG